MNSTLRNAYVVGFCRAEFIRPQGMGVPLVWSNEFDSTKRLRRGVIIFSDKYNRVNLSRTAVRQRRKNSGIALVKPK